MADERIAIEIVLDDGSIVKGFQKIESSAKATGEKAGNGLQAGLSKGISKVGKIIAVGIAAAGATAAGILSKSIPAAIIQENAINRLNSALALSGKFSNAASQDFQNFASQLQQNSKFGDELILSNAALIQSLGNLSVSGLKRATQASADLATALGVDLKSAATLVGKAAAGEVGSFSRYGLSIQKGATNAQTLENALTALEKKFGGSALNALNTFQGATTQVNNSFGDLFEEIGNIVIKSPLIIAAINKVGEGIVFVSKQISDFAKSGAFDDFIRTTAASFSQVTGAIVAPFELAFNTIKLGFNAFNTAIQFGLLTIVNSAITTVSALSNLPLVGDKLKESILPSLIDLKSAMDENLTTLTTDTKSSFDNLFSFETADKVEQFAISVANSIDKINPKLKELQNNLNETKQVATQVSIDIGKEISGRLALAFSKGIELMATNLAKGKNIFSGFRAFLLGTIADMAIQIGTMIIATAFAMTALVSFSLGQAIALGAGLIAIGAIMKATIAKGAGGGSDFNASAGSGAGGASNPAVGGDPSFNNIQEQQEPQASVIVNVQGSIFSTKETADNIVGLINDSFEQRGVKVFA